MSNSMINPSIKELLGKVDSRYTLVVMTAKRARQLIKGDTPLIEAGDMKPVTLAINEINAGVVTYTQVKEGIK